MPVRLRQGRRAMGREPDRVGASLHARGAVLGAGAPGAHAATMSAGIEPVCALPHRTPRPDLWRGPAWLGCYCAVTTGSSRSYSLRTTA